MRTVWLLILALMAWPAIRAAEVPLLEAASFAMPGQSQVMQFLAGADGVFVSARCAAPPPLVSPESLREPPRLGGRPGGLAAWEPDGTLRWQIPAPEATLLARAGEELVLAYDEGGLDNVYGVIWVEAATGGVRAHVSLPGRPLAMRYYPDANLTIVLLLPRQRLVSLDDAWMEMVALDGGGEPVWQWRAEVAELEALRMDGRLLVVGSRCRENPFMARLDPRTGAERWRKPWVARDPNAPPPAVAVTDLTDPIAADLGGVMRAVDATAVQLIHPDTGAVLHELPVRELFPAARVLRFLAARDRIYFAASGTDALTMAAVGIPTNALLWSHRVPTVTDSARDPEAWGAEVVLLARAWSGPFTGTVTRTELRVYAPDGNTLACLPADGPQWQDTLPPQPAGTRLYAARGTKLVALTHNTAE